MDYQQSNQIINPVPAEIKMSRSKMILQLLLHSLVVGLVTGLVGVIPTLGMLGESSSLAPILLLLIVFIGSIFISGQFERFDTKKLPKRERIPYTVLLVVLSLIVSAVVGALYIVQGLSGLGMAM